MGLSLKAIANARMKINNGSLNNVLTLCGHVSGGCFVQDYLPRIIIRGLEQPYLF